MIIMRLTWLTYTGILLIAYIVGALIAIKQPVLACYTIGILVGIFMVEFKKYYWNKLQWSSVLAVVQQTMMLDMS